MARPDRLFRLLQAMRVMPAPITAKHLAAETGVSLRSLYRDIESLRMAGALIEGERGYGYRLVEDYSLPPQTFGRAEIEALALGLAEVRAMGDETLARAATGALAKIAASLPTDREQQLFHAISQVFRPEPRIAPSPWLEPVRDACWHERVVHIAYADRDGQTTSRDIYPLSLVYTERLLTVLAWCCLREDFRMFHLSRITALETLDRSFRPRRVTLLRQYLAALEARGRSRQDAANRG